MSYSDKKIKNALEKTNKISPTFCMAKWYHVSMYLHQGNNHSCYHCKVHSMDLNKLQSGDLHGLHNTPWKKEQRKAMLKGEKPYECHYCWNVEDLGQNHISDRMLRNSEHWSEQYIEENKNLTGEEDVYPKYMEVSFSYHCNLRCSYCNAGASSRWHQELIKEGDYPVSNNQYNIDKLNIWERESENPFVDWWWEYLPKAYKHLHVLRLTGGEPLLHDSFYKLLSFIKENPNEKLELNCNSNMSVPKKKFDKFIEALKDSPTITKRFKLFASIDTWGGQAEYIRNGLDLDLFERNIREYLEKLPEARLSFMITYNCLSVVGFKRLLDKILELRKEFNNSKEQRIEFDVPYLCEPSHMTCLILPPEYIKYIDEQLDFIKNNITNSLDGFSYIEYKRLERVRDWVRKNNDYKTKHIDQADFYRFFNEHDKRRGVNFLKSFPEMIDFYNDCKDKSIKYPLERRVERPGTMTWMNKNV